jgi:ABC-type histidine transport system ATPase subunit
MDEGQIIEENQPKAFFDKPESERLQLFLGAKVKLSIILRCGKRLKC